VQTAFMAAHPGIAVLGAASRALRDGVPMPSLDPPCGTPALLAWGLALGLAPAAAALMVRTTIARTIPGVLTRAGVLGLCLQHVSAGSFARLDQVMVLHPHLPQAAAEADANEVAAALLASFGPIFGPIVEAIVEPAPDDAADRAAALVARHIALGAAVSDAATLAALARAFDRLAAHFGTGAAGARAVWGRVISATAAAGTMPLSALLSCRPAAIGRPAADLVRTAIAARLARKPAPPIMESAPGQNLFFATRYQACPSDPQDAPCLFVVVDTEAEFDWTKPFARELTSVSAMDAIERGQAVFDPYGLRPIYVVDYPIASQPRGFARLRAIMERDGCEIGAHLHPWTTPPFEEALSARNSYPGNLDPALEERKLASLMAVIRENFGVAPVFYKAGRYGFGPATALALERLGIRVDLSVLPGADLRRQGGPDFRALHPVLYRIGGTGMLCLPMTRSQVGLLPSLARLAEAAQAVPGGRLLHLPSILARLRLADTITLTPEGVTADEQARLIRAMLRRGTRRFVLHYHSPSLSPGHTPYAKDPTGAETLIKRLHSVCRFFFEEIGGVPGNPRDLLRAAPECVLSRE